LVLEIDVRSHFGKNLERFIGWKNHSDFFQHSAGVLVDLADFLVVKDADL
jgi:hypothetical protein